MDSLDLVKAIAPYATAVIAVAAAAFTAWLSHRNWIKQFGVQRSKPSLRNVFGSCRRYRESSLTACRLWGTRNTRWPAQMPSRK